MAGWVVASDDNRGLPFAVVDKKAAQILVFDKTGKLRGLAPALLGSALGDVSSPAVVDRELSAIPDDQRTTPAGRFLAGWGPAPDGKSVLWVDYATAVSLHAVILSNREEKRGERLASATPDDNRITHGCINVSRNFYDKVVRPTFRKAGVIYVLPDRMPLRDALPGYRPPRPSLLSLFGGSRAEPQPAAAQR